MFRTTVVNLSPDGAQASPDLGTRRLGELFPDEVRALLEQFRALDETTNAKAEPEIVFETRRQKFIVRTGQNRLHLYDPRDAQAPALILSVDEVIAELDGTAAIARSRHPFISSAEPTPVEDAPVALTAPPRTTLRPPHRLALGLASVGLAGYLGFTMLSAEPAAGTVGFEPVTDPQEHEHYRADLAGVYMTGQLSGDHGIALAADGTMKLFQLNAQGTPSLILDTFRVGRIDGELSVLGLQSTMPVRVTGRNTLSFGGENYRRLP